MIHTFENKRISAILSILPKHIAKYENELEDYPFPIKQSIMLGKMMDYNTRREIGEVECLSDYALLGIKRLIKDGIITKEQIDAIVVVTSSQDYIMPSVSYILQGKLDLNHDVYCIDIAQACGGYVYGLMQSFMLMDTFGFKTVLLVTGDTLTKKVCKHDRNSRPIIGDYVNVSVIEPATNGTIYSVWQNYGDQANAIKICAGGFKMPSTHETAIEKKDEQGNFRALDHFFMDGEAVFNFVMTKVPIMLTELFKTSQNRVDSIDYFMFHQPNKFMVHRLSEELDIPHEKCPDNIVGIYGNASTGTIPLNICHNIAKQATTRQLRLCLSGFGGGLTANAMILNNPKMKYVNIIEY